MNGGEGHTGLLWRNLRERHYLENLGVDGRIISTLILNKSVKRKRNGLIWLGIGTDGEVL